MESWRICTSAALRRRCVWAGLFCLLFASPSLGLPERVEKSSHYRYLTPFTSTEDHSQYSKRTLSQRDVGSGQLLGSGLGSGDSTLTPSSTPLPPIITPTVYIKITLLITSDEYSKRQREIEEKILQVLQSFLPAELGGGRRRATSEGYMIVLQLDTQKSSDKSVLKAYMTGSETGELDVQATAQLYDSLASNPSLFLSELESAIEIEVVDVRFIRDGDSAGPPLQSSSLRWWDFLMIVLGCVAAVACPVILALACCCRWFSRRREEEEKEGLLAREGDLDPSAAHTSQPRANGVSASEGLRERRERDGERREHVRRVARVGFQSRVQVQSHPLTPAEIENLLQNPATLRNEYSSIPSNLVTMADVPPGAEEKNRYKDILPNPQTRVSLFLKFAVSNSDYINANYIRGFPDSGRGYIATQGPLPWTVDDFWRMVWEQKTSVIVMVTGLEERRIVKCSRYWPDSQVALTASYGDLNVTLRKRVTTNPHFTVSHFHVTHREKLVSREVTHYWFTAWPDHGVPASTQPALDFLTHVRSHAQEIPAPIVVHCSAGIGRTGVFIGADVGMTQLERQGEVDALKIVSTMRQDRGGMVQTEKQYIFLHQLLLAYAHQLGSGNPPPSSGTAHDSSSSVGATSSSGHDVVLQNTHAEVM